MENYTIVPIFKVFIGVQFIIFWEYGLSSYNFYLEQWFLLERLLLLILPIIIWYKPWVLPIYLFVLSIFLGQFQHPFGMSYTDKDVLIKGLFMITASLITIRVSKKNITNIAVITLSAVFASNYAWSGIDKLLMQWLSVNELDNLFVAAYNIGWLGFLPESTVMYFALIINKLNTSMMLVALLVELMVLVMFYSIKWLRISTLCIILLHLGIYAASGILFWTWIIFALWLVWFYVHLYNKQYISLRNNFIIITALIFVAPFTLFPTRLAWYDSNLSSGYYITAHYTDGGSDNISMRAFTPFEVPFTQSRFNFLNDTSILNYTFGSMFNKEVYLQTLGVEESENVTPDLETIRLQHGRSTYDDSKTVIFKQFLQQYFTYHNQTNYFSVWHIPHFSIFNGIKQIPNNKQVTEIDVYYWEKFYGNEKILPILDKKLFTIAVQ